MSIFSSLKDVAKSIIPGVATAAAGGTWLGPAISAGASLLGQRSQNQYASSQTARNMRQQLQMQKRSQRISSRQQRDDTKRQFRWIRKGAEAAGFNPLTALGVGTAASQSVGAPLATVTGGSPTGAALESFANIMSNYDPIATETARLQNQLARQQLNNAKEKTERLGGGVPQVRSTQSPVEVKAAVDAAIGPSQGNLGRGIGYMDLENADPRVLRTNPDGSIEPAEIEVDAYGQAVKGDFWPYVGELNRLNNPYFDEFLKEVTQDTPNVWQRMTEVKRNTARKREKLREWSEQRKEKRKGPWKRSSILPSPDLRDGAKAAATRRGGW